MTYDDWKTKSDWDDRPPDPDYQCEFCAGYCVAIVKLCNCCDDCLATMEPVELCSA